jgi:hypothetical protein
MTDMRGTKNNASIRTIAVKLPRDEGSLQLPAPTPATMPIAPRAKRISPGTN